MFGTVQFGRWARVAQLLVILSIGAVGLTTLVSGLRGQPTELLGGMGGVITLLWTLAGATSAAALTGLEHRGPLPEGAWVVVGGALFLSTPILEYFLVSAAVRYSSHDTHPWTGAWAGAMFLIAGVAVLIGVRWQLAGWRWRRRTSAPRLARP